MKNNDLEYTKELVLTAINSCTESIINTKSTDNAVKLSCACEKLARAYDLLNY